MLQTGNLLLLGQVILFQLLVLCLRSLSALKSNICLCTQRIQLFLNAVLYVLACTAPTQHTMTPSLVLLGSAPSCVLNLRLRNFMDRTFTGMCHAVLSA